ncbi:CsbD family protein [Rhodopseudomonas palustris]|uniref:CsbD family protein n=1 Tax=Rhodopseudomonas palustris TaxID=1076 RepID=UPI0021F35FF2|nr:CsbD family protein [Rhodopseudomonas palustris]UYO53412.1 CsbD family protein [Rhodopseudomonas palustris]
MGSTMDKIKGQANELAGKAKQGIGEATGSDKLQGEGVIQEAKGHGQQALGNVKDSVKNAADKVAGTAHKNL